MESRIIYHIDKFVSYLFGENNYNDPEQRIYNKLLRLEGDELEDWMNKKIKRYITGIGYYFEFKEENFEGIYGSILFKTWHSDNIYNKNKEVMSMEEIFGENRYILIRFKEEYKIIKDKIKTFKKEEDVYYDLQLDWGMLIFMDYLVMYIMSMSSEDLKSYIIQLVDPVEIK
jgi:succinate dehydrogenase flavin-adding protein (antitoxin of CptAB toxin-antitoxin module)